MRHIFTSKNKLLHSKLKIPSFSIFLPLIILSLTSFLKKACRNDKVRKEVATAILKALTAPDVAAKADIPPQNIVVRFSEAVDGFPLPKGHDVTNCDVLENKDGK